MKHTDRFEIEANNVKGRRKEKKQQRKMNLKIQTQNNHKSKKYNISSKGQT
jgi:hypothetical protein